MITSLLAQPMNLLVLQFWCFISRLTADIALPKHGYQSFIASDVIANIGNAF
jgi:hypothetical protein